MLERIKFFFGDCLAFLLGHQRRPEYHSSLPQAEQRFPMPPVVPPRSIRSYPPVDLRGRGSVNSSLCDPSGKTLPLAYISVREQLPRDQQYCICRMPINKIDSLLFVGHYQHGIFVNLKNGKYIPPIEVSDWFPIPDPRQCGILLGCEIVAPNSDIEVGC